eukprot:6341931-Lingulodinium_polyedra.AAC.1
MTTGLRACPGLAPLFRPGQAPFARRRAGRAGIVVGSGFVLARPPGLSWLSLLCLARLWPL